MAGWMAAGEIDSASCTQVTGLIEGQVHEQGDSK
jgi:hypothetical protein